MAYYFSDKNIQAEYFTSMAKWLGRVRAKIVQWHARWSQTDLAPRLRFESHGNRVYDTRSGTVVWHSIGDAGRELLEFLAKPKHLDDVIKTFGAGHGEGTTALLDGLRKAGLIFQEGERLLSLVLEG
jgi:hypothetical protein